MFPNLDAEMAREKIEAKEIAEVMGVDRRTAWNKLNGHTRLYYDEAMAIRDNLFPKTTLEYLFSKTPKEFPKFCEAQAHKFRTDETSEREGC